MIKFILRSSIIIKKFLIIKDFAQFCFAIKKDILKLILCSHSIMSVLIHSM